ncbi:hypothetical protein DL98DRAFT_565592 [Cadophora sp. DSE1049]|nr:hypothetical protein DL98DRAFT_565592 [Cadophora sp. DSE1049]
MSETVSGMWNVARRAAGRAIRRDGRYNQASLSILCHAVSPPGVSRQSVSQHRRQPGMSRLRPHPYLFGGSDLRASLGPAFEWLGEGSLLQFVSAKKQCVKFALHRPAGCRAACWKPVRAVEGRTEMDRTLWGEGVGERRGRGVWYDVVNERRKQRAAQVGEAQAKQTKEHNVSSYLLKAI